MTLCLTLALILPLSAAGCGKKQKGQVATGTGVSKEVEAQSQLPFKVNNWIGRLTNGPDGDPGKRKTAATAVTKAAKDPGLTAEMKAQLIDALKKMIETEPMSEAEDAYKQEIIAAGNEALAALQGGAAPDAK
jgi:hypothetical protein